MSIRRIRDVELRYTLEGEGPLTVFLHGFGGSPGDWRSVAEDLKDGRRLIVNIKSLFSHQEPISFSHQVDLLCEFLREFVSPEEAIRLVGSSYGATLTFGIQARLGNKVSHHVLINPMPLDPLKELRNPLLRWLFFIYRLPTGVFTFALTPFGRSYLEALGRLFHMGLGTRKKIRRFNHRKWRLIRHAIHRFLWIARTEDWESWKSVSVEMKPTCWVIFGSQDFLFTEDTYRRTAVHFGSNQFVPVPGGGHELILSRPKLISETLERLWAMP
ncbi:MAG: alpha/beta hydrolase [Bdellovibrionaceae bacterium]|nr:alpha/beta hydrolase [Bdellovibrionales bacterium]MCB9084366.1 alpha/beta hydrolase [Pseudobdellovibrionaceae bacterium]